MFHNLVGNYSHNKILVFIIGTDGFERGNWSQVNSASVSYRRSLEDCHCPHQSKALFLSLLSTKYKNTFFMFTKTSHISSSTSATIYLPSLHVHYH